MTKDYSNLKLFKNADITRVLSYKDFIAGSFYSKQMNIMQKPDTF